MLSYALVFVLLLAMELLYFRLADRWNIIDKPNLRSSHSAVVLRGGGVIFSLAMIPWIGLCAFSGRLDAVRQCAPFLAGLFLVAGVSFADDIRSLPDSLRLLAHFAAMALLFLSWGILSWNHWPLLLLALVLCVGITNAVNFMDGINGITGAYSLSVLLPLWIMNRRIPFMDESFLVVSMLSLLVFCFFNFRPRNRARCFAGDVGSVAIAFIMVFALGNLVLRTGDLSWLAFLAVYGVDSVLTIVHRILLRENIGKPHRKHAYQLLANELSVSHVWVSALYALLQLAISLSMVCLVPSGVLPHALFLAAVVLLLSLAYIAFMLKFYHLHAEYLAAAARRTQDKP